VHEAVARARFPLEHVKKLGRSEHFWKMHETVARARFHINIVKNCRAQSTFGR